MTTIKVLEPFLPELPIKRTDSVGRYGSRYRHYNINGESYPSVTTILDHGFPKPALMKWAEKVTREQVKAAATKLYGEVAIDGLKPLSAVTFSTRLDEYIGKEKASDRIKNKAASIGTELHQYAHWYTHDRQADPLAPAPQLGPEAEIAAAELRTWVDKVQLKSHLSESIVYSAQFKYAGTLDQVATILLPDPVKCIIDWKSSSGIWPDMLLQVAAYANAYQESTDVDLLPGVIVKLPKKAGDRLETRWITVDEQYENLKAFLSVKKLYDWIVAAQLN